MVAIDVTFQNCGDSTLSGIRTGSPQLQSGMRMSSDVNIKALTAGTSQTVTVGIDFNDTLQPAKFEIRWAVFHPPLISLYFFFFSPSSSSSLFLCIFFSLSVSLSLSLSLSSASQCGSRQEVSGPDRPTGRRTTQTYVCLRGQVYGTQRYNTATIYSCTTLCAWSTSSGIIIGASKIDLHCTLQLWSRYPGWLPGPSFPPLAC